MQEDNQKESISNTDTNNTVSPAPEVVDSTHDTSGVMTEAEVAPVQTTSTPAVTTPAATLSPIAKYALAGLAVVIIVVGAAFVLERQGKISTGLFAAFGIGQSAPVARVNGVTIERSEYDSSLEQLLQMAAQQGVNTTDPAAAEQYKTQALETLVNGELLRQAALEAGMEASVEAIDARFDEIEGGVGGPEELATKMAEFGITTESLRRDIENEILIQGLFDTVIGSNDAPVTDEEISSLYEQLGGSEAGLPPLAEVRDQVAEQIRLERQQTEVSSYIDTLRADAEVEILI